MVVFQFIWNCIIGWIELLDKIPVYTTSYGSFSALDLILSFVFFIIFLRFIFVVKED